MSNVFPLPDRAPARTVSEQIAEEVRALLARRRISHNKARQALGWSSGYMARRISGEAPLDVEDIAKLAALLDVPMSAFFPGSMPPAAATGERVGVITDGITAR